MLDGRGVDRGGLRSEPDLVAAGGDVLAIDAPRTEAAANVLLPVARAKVSMRIAPGQDPAAAQRALADHLVAPARPGA